MDIKKRDNDSVFGRLSRLEKIFNNFFSDEDYFFRPPVAKSSWSPRIDIREDGDKYLITAEFPGVEKDDIDITLENNVLTIKGEKKVCEKNEKEEFIHMERTYGSFYRSFRLP